MPKEYGTPGPRAIYPDICTSRSVATCSIEAQLLFDRLIAQADDQGRIEGDALVIKSLCVPLVREIPAIAVGRGARRRPGIDELLGELEAEELVARYQVGRAHLIQIITWWRWQQGQRRCYPSRWPAPDGWTDPAYGRREGDPPSYQRWLDAAPSGSAPHNAAWRGSAPHSAAQRGSAPHSAAQRGEPPHFAAPRARERGQASADSGALTGAESLPRINEASTGGEARVNGPVDLFSQEDGEEVIAWRAR